jgi:hypothetical protein
MNSDFNVTVNVESLGAFTIFRWQGQYSLLHDENIVAECKDYKLIHGNIQGWIKHVLKRSVTRQIKIDRQIEELKEESRALDRIINSGFDLV